MYELQYSISLQANIAIIVMAVKEVKIKSQKVSKIEKVGVKIEQMNMVIIPQNETRAQKQVKIYHVMLILLK